MVRDGVAHERRVDVAHRSGRVAAVAAGLASGDQLVLFAELSDRRRECEAASRRRSANGLRPFRPWQFEGASAMGARELDAIRAPERQPPPGLT